MTWTRVVWTFPLLLLSFAPTYAQDIYAIENARIVTVSGETIEKGTVVIENGRISAVGAGVSVPSQARVIDAQGLSVYPGLFDSNTRLGLTEVGQVQVTNDFDELGDFMPQLLAFTAFHVESEHISVARVDGITHVLTWPGGGVIPGQAAIMNLSGWSPEEMEINRRGALVINFPSLMSLSRGFFGRSQTYTEQKKDFDEKLAKLKEFLAKARHYQAAKESNAPGLEFNSHLDALIPVLKGEEPVVISADSFVDIKEAVKFAQEEKLNFIIEGASDAWKAVDFLKENNVRVILGPRQTLPVREDDPIDIYYQTPRILHENGVRFALSTESSSDVRTLPFEIGNCVSYGLPYEAALRSITLTPAEFFGIQDRLGSVEKGKIANLVVAEGDILDYRASIKHIFINGKPVSLESKHTQLYEKYLNRPE